MAIFTSSTPPTQWKNKHNGQLILISLGIKSKQGHAKPNLCSSSVGTPRIVKLR